MHWTPATPLSSALVALFGLAPVYASAKIDVSIEQVQQRLFPGMALVQTPFIVSGAVQQQMTQASSVRHPFRGDRIWRAADGGWLIVDEVIGKHEMITYALGLSPDGAVLNLPEGKGTTTIESKTNFVGPAPVGTTVIGETTPVHRGRRTMVWTTRITTAEGKLVAVVTQTQMVL